MMEDYFASKAPREWKHQKHKESNQLTSECRPENSLCYTYFQMEICVADITEAFEVEVTKRIAHQVKINEASFDDCHRLVVLHNRAFLTASDPYVPIKDEDMAKVLRFQGNIVLIATIWGEDAGFIILGFDYYPSLDPIFDDPDIPDGPTIPPMHAGQLTYNVGYISGLAVDPRWQRRGIGNTLGIASWHYFKARQLVKLRCEVYEKNYASYRLISGLGFRNVGSKTYSYERQRAEPLQRL